MPWWEAMKSTRLGVHFLSSECKAIKETPSIGNDISLELDLNRQVDLIESKIVFLSLHLYLSSIKYRSCWMEDLISWKMAQWSPLLNQNSTMQEHSAIVVCLFPFAEHFIFFSSKSLVHARINWIIFNLSKTSFNVYARRICFRYILLSCDWTIFSSRLACLPYLAIYLDFSRSMLENKKIRYYLIAYGKTSLHSHFIGTGRIIDEVRCDQGSLSWKTMYHDVM